MSKEYVRCKFCDSAFFIEDQIKIHKNTRYKIKGVAHERGEWSCPACAGYNSTFIFPDGIKE